MECKTGTFSCIGQAGAQEMKHRFTKGIATNFKFTETFLSLEHIPALAPKTSIQYIITASQAPWRPPK